MARSAGCTRRAALRCCRCRAETRSPTSCCLPAAISKAVGQLVVQARIIVFVLATTNPQLLEVLGPLKVVGTVEVVGRLSHAQKRFWAGRERDVSCSAAPETASLRMQLRVRP